MRPICLLIRPQVSHTEGRGGVIIPTIKGLPGAGLWIWGIRDRWLGGEEEGRHEDWEGKGGGGEERERTKGEIW